MVQYAHTDVYTVALVEAMWMQDTRIVYRCWHKQKWKAIDTHAHTLRHTVSSNNAQSVGGTTPSRLFI